MVLDYKGVRYEPLERCYSIDRKEDLHDSDRPFSGFQTTRTRGRMRVIEDLCDGTFDGVAYGYWVAMMRAYAPESEAMRKAARSEFEGLIGVLEREVGNADFLCDRLTLADLTAICCVAAAPAVQVDLPHSCASPDGLKRRGRCQSCRAIWSDSRGDVENSRHTIRIGGSRWTCALA